MGLDCYIVHANDRDKSFTHEDDDRLKDISLCGGMLSGGGSDGSFRGKVYEPLIDELTGGDHVWHKQEEDDYVVLTDELKEHAHALGDLMTDLLLDAEGDGTVLNDDDVVYKTTTSYYENEYTWKEICDLERLLRVASERRAVMQTWW
tara:strand:+ start:624 stop:1067 length:444 start_codon:yes stop_codon:yes gene_type:complete